MNLEGPKYILFLVLFSHFPKRMLYTFSLGLGIMGCIYFLTSRWVHHGKGQQDSLTQ